MKSQVYVETTIISYLAAKPTRNAYQSTLQRKTRQWWLSERRSYQLVTSEVTILEAAGGDAIAAEKRLRRLRDLPLLPVTDQARKLAELLVGKGAFPPPAQLDALHVAVCAVHHVPFLLTWNFKHLANAVMRDKIRESCLSAGFACPVICNPLDL